MTSTSNDSFRTVGVVGAGTMGHGIAQVLVRHGYSAILRDVCREILDRADGTARRNGRASGKG